MLNHIQLSINCSTCSEFAMFSLPFLDIWLQGWAVPCALHMLNLEQSASILTTKVSSTLAIPFPKIVPS